MRTVLALVVSILASAGAALAQVFPYEHSTDDLENGLRLITVPTEHREVVSVYIVVQVGSRDEVEYGKSGFAHFFEHMMFRGSKNYTSAEQTAIFKKAGADRNAYTTDDYTCYHTTFSVQDLEQVLAVEADRFKHLTYSEEDFRTEAKAILGEYNTSSSNPLRKLVEVLRDTAFRTHTYKHTTMGFLADIEKMPEQFEYSLQFFRRHYRPEKTTVLVVGDVRRDVALRLVRRYWGDWSPPAAQAVPRPQAEPEQRRGLRCHVPWSSPTRPWLVVSHKGPAFSTTERDMAVLDVIATVAFSESSELYKKLFVRDAVVDVFFPDFPDHTDPYLLSVCARVNRPEDVAKVQREILGTFEQLAGEPIPAAVLERAKAKLKYGFAAGLDSPAGVAGTLAGYIGRARTADAVNQVYALYDQVTVRDVMATAKKYFVDSRRTIATLSHGDLPGVPTGESETSAPAGELPIAAVLQPTSSPLVSFRIVFRAGSALDPPGKEGLAYVTARLLAQGSTTEHEYEDIVERLFPMAASIGFQVDKEMTVFHGTVHRDNARSFRAILEDMLIRPGFRAAELERVKSNTVGYLDDGLRRSDVEELGKEVLYNEVYAGHPYGHHNAGALDAVGEIWVQDVRSFHARYYTPDRVTLGLAGGFSELLPWNMAEELARGLPRGPAEGAQTPEIPLPRRTERTTMTIVQKQMGSTGIHIGFPIPVNRSHPEWAALWLARSWLGQHRSDNSHLYQRLREVRGLNYGDYAYIEYFPDGSRQFQEDPNLARKSQIFQIWIRPVEPVNGPFALKAAVYELGKLAQDGLTPEQFEATRTFLSKYVHLLVKTQDRRLGYAIDSRYYGIDDFVPFVKSALAWLTVDDVNRAIAKHLRPTRMNIVVVTEDAKGFRDAILGSAPTPPRYGTPPAADVLAEDEVIDKVRLDLRPEDVKIVPVDEVFR